VIREMNPPDERASNGAFLTEFAGKEQ